MPLDFTFTCPLPNGIHARPASALEAVTRDFLSRLTLVNQRSNESADARSVLAIVGLAIAAGDVCRFIADGPDEAGAIEAVRRFVEQRLPHCDDQAPGEAAPPRGRSLPPLLRDAGATLCWGQPASGGIGRGRAVRLRRLALSRSIPTEGIVDVAAETARVDAALRGLVAEYDARIEGAGRGTAADVLGAHRSVARDPGFRRRIVDALSAGTRTAAGAILDAQRHFTGLLARSASQLLRERAADVRDVSIELLRTVYGRDAMDGEPIELTVDTVGVADDLTPGEFLALDRTHLKGLVLASGSTTTHTTILARSFGVPTIVGVEALDEEVYDGRDVVVDGSLGVVATGLTVAAERYFALEQARLEARARRLQQAAREPAVTVDGQRLEIGANIATAEEAEAAFAAGADGIGVFRTEMLFARRDEAPGEEEQLAAYRTAAEAGGGRRVTVRTLDVGGDKPLPFLRLPPEANPFLGYRAVRMYPEYQPLLRDQVRAIVRASTFGRIELLIPFVTSVDEVHWVRRVLAEEQRRAGQAAPLAIGAMIEVPAMAFALDHLAPALDFFSIGSNDLLQYFMAADRSNARVASLYDPFAPAFLRFLHTIVESVRAHGRWIGLCGEIAADAACLPLLVGLGLDELSVAAPHVGRVKHDVRALSAAACRALLDGAMACATAADVRGLAEAVDCRASAPLVAPDLVAVDLECRSREEVLKQVADRLFVAGRTDRPQEIEEALWQRESTCSTAVGHGFAVPHCRSRTARVDSLVVLKLAAPVDWGSGDGTDVDVIVALVLGEGANDAHLRLLSALARRLMHGDFRAAVAASQDPAAVADLIAEAIGESSRIGETGRIAESSDRQIGKSAVD